MTDDSILRIAAIMAVLNEVIGASDAAQIGRNLGESWSQDHRRVITGSASLLQTKSARAPWR